ncbi:MULTISPECIES: hypothetical protein [unclassified Frondihabitans]|uniref:hypothetical protein n=1 Tax=unclassified Frondihabitans TaxID=2626248 RepID=UPI000F511A2D|nr:MULTISPECIES: hypothetical protein [unclassified Frondihabitans]RPE76467.1 hypothetical protein EDF37_2292 [Frondihabitans sp. PhB153]RPF05257.1 hypothetical protein EDF39_1956 [Frondihabitans sp. PhB161]
MNGDLWERTVSVEVQDLDAIWDVLNDARGHFAHLALASGFDAKRSPFTAVLDSGSRLTRKSLADLREVVESERESIKYLTVTSYAKSREGTGFTFDDPAKADVTVWRQRPSFLSEVEVLDVRIHLSGTSRSLVAGIETELREYLVTWAKDHADALEAAQPASETDGADPTARPAGSWLRNTWRNHATSLVVSVVAGLTVVVLSTWLGLRH